MIAMVLGRSRLAFSANAVSLLRWRQRIQHGPSPRTLQENSCFFGASTLKLKATQRLQWTPAIRMISTSPQISSSQTKTATERTGLSFQDAVLKLQRYWVEQGCVLVNSCNSEVGAGTMNPATFLRALGPEPWNVAYVEPSVRPDDSRYGENPNRVQMHTQFQVLLKPAPSNPQELVLGSYEALGIDVARNDIRFVEDNWEHPALGAWGLGWEVWLNGMEITQFTYFQQVGGEKLDTVAVEVTYGLERILMSLQNVTHFKDIEYASGLTYGEMYMQNEIEMSAYNMDHADTGALSNMFDLYEKEASALLDKQLPIPAYGFLLKASHVFNILDSRGAIGVTERANFFKRMRNLARKSAQLWLRRREELEFPLIKGKRKSETQQASIDSSAENGKDIRALKPEECFALEIGFEELPPGDVDSIIEQVDTQLRKLLKSSSLSFGDVRVFGTPRRLVATISSLQTKQTDVTKRARGPPENVVFAEDGQLSKAGTGFLRSQGGLTPEDLEREGGYVYTTRKITGKLASDLLVGELPQIIEKISFSRTMKWDSTGSLFARPIRWIVALLGDQVIPFQSAGISSSNITKGLRGSRGEAKSARVQNAKDLLQKLQDLELVPDGRSRREIIEENAKRLAGEVKGSLVQNDVRGDLMKEVVNLVENPIAIRGQFDEEFLKLPREVLASVMKKHQRYFPIVRNTDGSLLPYFITVVNGSKDVVDIGDITRGNEAVLRARYSDAAFFYQKDTEKELSEFVPLLSGIMFQEKLGSMLDKTHRLESISTEFANMMELNDQDTFLALEGAKFCKADLATQMVVEMTSLAGIMGKHYAKKSKSISSEVAEVILEAALPRFAGDALPKSLPGVIVAVADRLDSLIGLCSVGILPKSNSDPFAMRRAALGIVSTLIENSISLNIGKAAKVVGMTIDGQGVGRGNAASEDNLKIVTDFIARRLEVWFLDNGFRPDVVSAVLSQKCLSNNPFDACTVVKALQDAFERGFDKLDTAVEVYNRAARFLKSAKGVDTTVAVDTDLFDSDLEHDLHKALCAAENFLKVERNFHSVQNKLVGMKSEVDRFFDGVFINTEDGRIRQNRIALCRRIVALPEGVASLDALQMTR